MLDAKYRYKKINQKLSFKIRDHSIFLLKRINSASTISILNTKRSRKLPASSVSPRLYPNQSPTGLDPTMSIQKVGTQSAQDASGFRLRSMTRSTMTTTVQIMRATVGGIVSINWEDLVWEDNVLLINHDSFGLDLVRNPEVDTTFFMKGNTKSAV